jgi:HD-GYP domain-containing protein (c-di-GMP phosphodiesterase class II)
MMTVNPAAQKNESGSKDARDDEDNFTKILQVMEKLSQIKDVHALLAEVLFQARRLTRADAGSIYLIENNVLNFSYIQNDTLFADSEVNRYLYASDAVAIDNHSLSGYVALTGKPLLIDDAYHLPPGMPFTFNDSFDCKSGYRTHSILAVPLITSYNKTVGVMQIINPLNDDRQASTFTPGDLLLLKHFADNAAAAIERAMLTREIIMRMIRMCELRDPKETGMHANRVGAYAAEVYHQWSLNQGIAEDEIKRHKDSLRIAAMLHDLGKVAISDLILRKPDKLNSHEFRIMQYHTIHGARLFRNQESDLDVLSAEIALNHHEKWDGTGYPGKIDDIYQDQPRFGPGKRGEEIPLAARIVALADIYDALVSPRAYKDAWSETTTLGYIKAQSGKLFDPSVVDAFLAIYDVITAIRGKYPEEAEYLDQETSP